MNGTKNNSKNKKSDEENEYKKYSKRKKAKLRLRVIRDQAEKIIEKLDLIAKLFKEILNENCGYTKKRVMVKNVPYRIEFEYIGLDFYIDFTLLSINGDDQTDIRGSIIYGVNRTLCFVDCIFPETNEETNDKSCDRIARCDKFEDKPLFQFLIDRHGLIKSCGKLEDEWWVKEEESEDKESLEELHYRTLVTVWNEALDWTNETRLP